MRYLYWHIWHNFLVYSCVINSVNLKIKNMSSKLLTGFVAGLIAGILLAPDKGSETRKKLTEKGKDLKNKFNDFIDGLQHKFEEVKEEAEKMTGKGKEKAQSFSETGNNSWAG